MSRHPAAAGRRPVSRLPVPAAARPPVEPAPVAAPASVAAVAALLTGPWRVDDPVGFAAAMSTAPLVAGYPVVDLLATAAHPATGLDPLSAATAGRLEAAVAGAATRSGLDLRWVAARQGSRLYVEAAGRAGAGADGPELLLIAHLVDGASGTGGWPAGRGARRLHPAADGCDGDDSWLVVVIGDGQGRVSAVGRAPLTARAVGAAAGPLALGRLRARLLAPARAAEGLGGPGADGSDEAVVLPFRPGGRVLRQ
jgi:hypothetical protein